MRFPVVRWLLSLPAAMFYCLAASGFDDGLGPPFVVFALALAPLFFLSSMGLWVLADARQRQRSLPYDFGSFIFFAWPLIVPVYLFATRGWRAFVTLGCFLAIYLAALLLGSLLN